MENTTFIKTVMLYAMKEAREGFRDWLKAELDTRNLGIRRGAQFLGISHPTLSEIINYNKMPSEETCRAIIAELSARRKTFRGKLSNQLTGLVYCGVCGAPLWIIRGGRYTIPFWRCSISWRHGRYIHDDLLARVAAELSVSVARLLAEPDVTKPGTPVNVADLEAQRSRLEDAYQAGVLSLQNFTARTVSIDTELGAARSAAVNAAADAAERQAKIEIVKALAADPAGLAAWIANEDAGIVNHTLRRVVKRIVVGDVIRLEFA